MASVMEKKILDLSEPVDVLTHDFDLDHSLGSIDFIIQVLIFNLGGLPIISLYTPLYNTL